MRTDDLRIKKIRRRFAQSAKHGLHILQAGVDDLFNRRVGNQFPERPHVEIGQRIDQRDARGRRRLDQAELGQIRELADELAVVGEGAGFAQGF